jgi:hypothetical protein
MDEMVSHPMKKNFLWKIAEEQIKMIVSSVELQLIVNINNSTL